MIPHPEQDDTCQHAGRIDAYIPDARTPSRDKPLDRLIGAGKLGQALCGYSGFDAYGLNILAAFDTAPVSNATDEGKPIYHISQLESFCRANKVLMGIITVPAEGAQEVADLLIAGGIKAIWNFAPIDLQHPEDMVVVNVHLSDSLQQLSYRMAHRNDP